MTAPYMPLYIADYLADTTHLTRSEHGAYLLLLMAMWRGGGKLPADDTRLARLAKCSPKEWADMRDIIMAFFKRRGGVIWHKRLTAEYDKYTNSLKGKSQGGKTSARNKANKNNGNDGKIADSECQQNSTNQNQNQNHIDESISNETLSSEARDGWERFRSLYPRHRLDDAERAFYAAADELHDPQPLIDALRLAVDAWKREGTAARFIPSASNWLGKGKWRGLAVVRSAPAAWAGPADIRAAVVAEAGDAFAVSYIDTSTWQDGMIATATNYALQKLLPLACLRDMGISIIEGSGRKTA